ncbi:SPOR domain-containing protein [Phenylobacterium sp.]|jgi:outer membrane biosynthesis protein TonB|uniref:cell division protein FtsN n=1 Tax=Phenylobacterium sp. TaxID=1871053 RepID=UPI002F93DADC
MSDHDRGAYTPPTTDAPLSFDARQPVRGARPIPFTLIISALVLVALVVAIVIFYRSGVREAGQPPQTVGAPVTEMKAAAPAEEQPQDPAAGLQIYRSEAGQPPEAVPPTFTPPPEQPQPRPAPAPVVVAPPAAAPTQPVTTASPLRPALPAAQAPAPKAAQPAPAAPAPAPKAAPAPAPTPKAAAAGGAAVQIGAVSSQALADKAWNEAVAAAPGLGAGKGKSVERIERDGSVLFRTAVTGFADRAQAVAFCNRLKAAGKSCFVR